MPRKKIAITKFMRYKSITITTFLSFLFTTDVLIKIVVKTTVSLTIVMRFIMRETNICILA